MRIPVCFCRYCVFKVETQTQAPQLVGLWLTKAIYDLHEKNLEAFCWRQNSPFEHNSWRGGGTKWEHKFLQRDMGSRRLRRIYYSLDSSYRTINASCYSAIPIQGYNMQKRLVKVHNNGTQCLAWLLLWLNEPKDGHICWLAQLGVLSLLARQLHHRCIMGF